MKVIKMPQFDVNDNMVTITELFVENGTYVNKGDRILKAESTKMVRDVVSDDSGYIHLVVKCFDTKENGAAIAYLFENKEECESFTVETPSDTNDELPANATAKAIAGLVSDEELNENNILPEAFDPRVADVVSKAVKALI